MRDRTNSGVRLDYYARLVTKNILHHQDPCTGLFAGTSETYPNHAWVRDNCYATICVWALSIAYRKSAERNEDFAKAYQLESSVVKAMRALMQCMMRQLDKVEQFKHSCRSGDALHAKFCAKSFENVVGDHEWGHLQLDATSLFLLTLSQMTSSGLQIIYTLDEVNFIQNLVFYIETTYRTPDYGVWERGDKTNHGVTELNATSIGMAKAALEAVNELDLFSPRGGDAMIDEAQQCNAVLTSMLPRESSSKEVDAALLTIIGFPAFAVDDERLIQLTMDTVRQKLKGNYGFKRFLRDGYRTPLEDRSRLHYYPHELKLFDQIECEWPMFYAFLALYYFFQDDVERAVEHLDSVEKLLVTIGSDETKALPELYTLPHELVEAEKCHPGSQRRVPSGSIPHLWGMSLYLLCRMFKENLLSPGEIDSLNRRIISRPKPDLLVQVVILAETDELKNRLAVHGFSVQTFAEVSETVEVLPAKGLSFVYSHLGKNHRMGLSGRPRSDVGLLATSKLYSIDGRLYAFMPHNLDQEGFYIALDEPMMMDIFKADIESLRFQWRIVGRPVVVLPVRQAMLKEDGDGDEMLHPSLLATLRKLNSGYLSGTQVSLGNLADFISTSNITKVSFLADTSAKKDLWDAYVGKHAMKERAGGLRHLERASLARRRSFKSIGLAVQAGLTRTQSSSRRISSWNPGARNQSDEAFNLSNSDSFAFSREASSAFLKGGTVLYSNGPVGFRQRHSSDRVLFSLSGSKDDLDSLSVEEAISHLAGSESIVEQTELLCHLKRQLGLDGRVQLMAEDDSSIVTIGQLLAEIYQKASRLRQWWLVRLVAGALRKRVPDLAKVVTDLLVRQKRISIGQPSSGAVDTLINRPLADVDLAALLHQAYALDDGAAVLSQEVLSYLALFIRTDPKLFAGILQLRIGLILDMMADELGTALGCSCDEGINQLINLSPFELKTLLYHILSGREFAVKQELSMTPRQRPVDTLSPPATGIRRTSISIQNLSGASKEPLAGTTLAESASTEFSPPSIEVSQPTEEEDSEDTGRQCGRWLRRRRLDGALNRVPAGFHARVWRLLLIVDELDVYSYILHRQLTEEMTMEETKFALRVEEALSRIPQPAYRQLIVEAMTVLTLMADPSTEAQDQHQAHRSSCKRPAPLFLQSTLERRQRGGYIFVDQIVYVANSLFLADQKANDGDAVDCCAAAELPDADRCAQLARHPPETTNTRCKGIYGICRYFYDSAPSGQFGTLTYMVRAGAALVDLPTPPGEPDLLDCALQ